MGLVWRLAAVAERRPAASAALPVDVPHGRSIPGALGERLFAPVDIASLVAFRIAFGAIMMWEVWRYVTNGWINRYFIEPRFHFTYYGFEWVGPWPGGWMYVHFWILGVLAACILAGALYRITAILFFLGISYTFLLDQATYLNHVYLVCVVSFLMIFVPCHRALSADGWVWPRLRSTVAPTWALWVLRFQIAVPYVYGGIAKLNADWLQGEPVRMWLARRADRPLVGPLLTEEWVVYLISYGGLAFDLMIVPLLLWRRTRVPAFLLALAFHLTNAFLFNIGIFPWFMIAATLLFFPPDWPRHLARRASNLVRRSGRPVSDGAPPCSSTGRSRPGVVERVVVGVLAVHVLAQLVIPLRHWLYPGDVAWTEEGHLFSWRMKLRDKAHTLRFLVHLPSTGETREIDPRQIITAWQDERMDGHPDMVLQLAHYIAARYRAAGYEDVQVRALLRVSLNGRRRQDLIDPTVDLAAQGRSIWPADWLLPLTEPLRKRGERPGSS